MADNLAARREARRRRILENSEERLKRITGDVRSDVKDGICVGHGVENGPVGNSYLPTDEKRNGPVINRCSKPNVEDNVYGFPSDVSEPADSDILSRLLASAPEGIFLQDKSVPQQKTFLKTIQESRFHIVGVAVLVRLLFYFGYGFMFGESILVPLLIFELTDITLMITVAMTTPSSLPGGLLATMLMFNGVNPAKASSIGTCISICIKVGQDFALYFVSFVAIHCLLGWPG